MLEIKTHQLGKRFNREWIFRNLNYTFLAGERWAVVGPNGSGKSTLLQVLSGIMPLTEGKILYNIDNQEIEIDDWYRQIVIAAPYLELIEEFSTLEMLDFHRKFKPFKLNITVSEIIDSIELQPHKPIKYFSSGMKQRLKLALAFYSDTNLVMLDEPTSNLDTRWTEWYQVQMAQISQHQIVIVCSNLQHEYESCENILDLRTDGQVRRY